MTQTTTSAGIAQNPLLPAVFVVRSMSKGKHHLGSEIKKPLCGGKLSLVELTDTEIKFEDGQLKERWFDALSSEGVWIKVFEFHYCKKCLSVLNGR